MTTALGVQTDSINISIHHDIKKLLWNAWLQSVPQSLLVRYYGINYLPPVSNSECL